MQTKQETKDIKIVPIFDQMANPKIWSDFTRLEMLCDTVKYGYRTGDDDRNRIFASHMYDWTHERYNFAFVAYDEKAMVGFANGFLENRSEMYLRNLYVDPQYNGLGIGKRLLEQSERTANLIVPSMSVISLNGAISFYEGRGYESPDNRYMLKKLPHNIVGVVPVFKNMLGGMRAKMMAPYDKQAVRQCVNQPVFVYVTADREIDAVGIRMPDKEIKIWTNEHKHGMVDFYKNQLLKAFEKVK